MMDIVDIATLSRAFDHLVTRRQPPLQVQKISMGIARGELMALAVTRALKYLYLREP